MENHIHSESCSHSLSHLGEVDHAAVAKDNIEKFEKADKKRKERNKRKAAKTVKRPMVQMKSIRPRTAKRPDMIAAKKLAAKIKKQELKSKSDE